MTNKKKYFYTYFWSFFEYLTFFLSLFFVTPKITGSLSVEVYGVYIAVLSYTIFLGYSDFGFLGASYKFGCDEFIKGNKVREVEILSSATFIQILTYILFALVMVYFAFHPYKIIKGLTYETEIISRDLFLLLAIFSFASIPRRIITYISQFRIEFFRVTKGLVVVNLLNILSVFIIFGNNNSYNVVIYYFMVNFITLIAIIIITRKLFERWSYSLRLFLKKIRFNKEVLKFLFPFAKANLFNSLMFLLYYELDGIFIAKFISVEQLAFYAIGLNIMNFFRRFSSTLNSPYAPKYNKYYVENDDEGMKNFYLSNQAVVAPFTFIPAIVMVILMQQFVVSWVGERFIPSIIIGQILVSGYYFLPLTDFCSYIITAKIKIKHIYISSFIVNIIFWTMFFTLKDTYGILIVAIAKLISAWIMGIYYFYNSHKIIKLRIIEYFRKIILPILITSIFVVIITFLFTGISVTKSRIDLLKIIGIEGGICLFGLIFYIMASKQFRLAIGVQYFNIPRIKDEISNRIKTSLSYFKK